MYIVRTSPINTAFLSTLNHAEFITSNPVRDFISGAMHSSARHMAANAGLVAMSNLAQVGMAFFDMQKLRKLKNSTTRPAKEIIKKQTKGGEEEKDSDDDSNTEDELEEEEERDTVQRGVSVLVSNKEIPTINDLMSFLKRSFTDLTAEEYACLQSVIPDLYIFQEFTRPLDFKEELQIQRVINTAKMKLVDLTEGGNDSDDNEISKLKFKDIMTTKVPAISTTSKALTSPIPGTTKATTPGTNNNKTPTIQKSFSSCDHNEHRIKPSTKGLTLKTGI